MTAKPRWLAPSAVALGPGRSHLERSPGLFEAKRWKRIAASFALRGGLAFCLAAGGAILSVLGGPTAAVVLLLSAYILADSVPAFLASAALASRALAVAAAVNAAVGAALLLAIDASPYAVAAIVGVWAMATGMLAMLAAGAFPARGRERRILGAAGVVAVVLGTGLGLFPHTGLAALAGLVAIFGLSAGALFWMLAAGGLARDLPSRRQEQVS